MRYCITTQGDRINVRIDDVSGHEPAILLQIRRCRESAWACPSGECLNIGSIDERIENGSMVLTLSPRPGAQIDPSGISECIGYMLHPVIKS